MGNLIAKSNFKDCQNQKHSGTSETPQSSEVWFCLTCGFIGCDRTSALQCSLKHYEKANHSLSINPLTLVIWCYQCDHSIDEMLELADNKNKGEGLKLVEFKEKTTQVFYKAHKDLLKTKNPGVTVISKNEEIEPVEQAKSVDPSNSKTVFGLKNIGNTCII